MYETLDQLVRGVIKPSDLPPSQVFRQHDKHDNHVDLRHQLGKGERSIAPQGARARTQSHEAGGQGTGEQSIAPQGAGARTHDSHTLAALWCAHGSTGASS